MRKRERWRERKRERESLPKFLLFSVFEENGESGRESFESEREKVEEEFGHFPFLIPSTSCGINYFVRDYNLNS